MTEPRPPCSIVIRAYNEERHIARLFEGIRQQTLRGVEIILVDSGSTDATVSIATQYQAKVLHIRPDEFTFGRSLNLGIQQARSPYIVIASAHVYPVYPDWLEHLLAPFKDPKISLVYGKQRGNKTSQFSENRVLQQWFPDHSQMYQPHPFCNNANAAIRRQLWEQHCYDETLTGLEDLEWAHWAMEQGYGIAYAAEAEIIHVHNETPRGVYNRYMREAMAFKRIFPEERFTLWDLLRLVSSNILHDMWYAAQERNLTINISSILWFRWMQFWGTYQGYRHSGPVTRQLRRMFYYPLINLLEENRPSRDVDPIQYNDAPEG